MSSSHNDMTDAAASVWNAMKQFGSPTGRAASSSSAAAINHRAAGKSAMNHDKAADWWNRSMLDSMKKASIFNSLTGSRQDNAVIRRVDFRIDHMRKALKDTKSKHLPAYTQMSHERKLHFIARVERHQKKQYPNQQHMRDIYAHYIAARVAHELKE